MNPCMLSLLVYDLVHTALLMERNMLFDTKLSSAAYGLGAHNAICLLKIYMYACTFLAVGGS